MNQPFAVAKGHFADEFRLACLCCQLVLAETEWAEVRTLLTAIDVPTFCDLVLERHRIGPLVQRALSQLGALEVPAEIRERLAKESRCNAFRVLQAQRAHVVLARKLALEELGWFAFKGITLAQRYYSDASARHANDIDIWVPETHRSLVAGVLRSAGFASTDAAYQADMAARGAHHAAFMAKYCIEEVHVSRELGTLELHWNLALNPHQFTLDPFQILARAQSVQVGSERVRTMCDEDLLLYLCEHGGRHGWARLKWLVDIPRVLQGRLWDWPAVFSAARAAGCEKSLALGLSLSRDLLNCPMAPEVDALIARVRVVPRAQMLVYRFLQTPAASKRMTVPQIVAQMRREVVLSMMLASGPASILNLVWRQVLSPSDLELVKVPDRFFGLYYLLRPFLSLIRVGRRLLPG